MRPTMNTTIERISILEREYVSEVLETQFATSKGAKFMQRLERAFSQRYNNFNAISFTNGTATMHAALEAAGIGVGDEVIVPPLTMASTTFAVLQANASPVFADIDPNTFQIDPADIERKITKNTKAIITVAIYGGSPKLKEIREIADRYDLFLLEDNAECFGGTYLDRPVGCYGHAASFSFQSSKHLSSGEGGILLIEDDELADDVRRFQSLGYAGVGSKAPKIDKLTIQDPNYKRHATVGFNYRMPELCAAVALAQVERMDELISLRIRAATAMEAICEKFPGVLTPQQNYIGATNSYWTWVCKLNPNINLVEFKKTFMDNGGDPFYGAWALTYNEPFIVNLEMYGRDKFLTPFSRNNLFAPNCPVADELQPLLCQFQTNYYSDSDLETQCLALELTLNYFHG